MITCYSSIQIYLLYIGKLISTYHLSEDERELVFERHTLARLIVLNTRYRDRALLNLKNNKKYEGYSKILKMLYDTILLTDEQLALYDLTVESEDFQMVGYQKGFKPFEKIKLEDISGPIVINKGHIESYIKKKVEVKRE